MPDIRLDIGFLGHAKTMRLEAECGPQGVLGLIRLWLWAGVYRTEGDLRQDDRATLASVCMFPCATCRQMLCGCSADALRTASVAQLEAIGFIKNGCLHDWSEHQKWVIGAKARSEAAKKGAAARHQAVASADALRTASGCSAPLPLPLPLPSSLTSTSDSTGIEVKDSTSLTMSPAGAGDAVLPPKKTARRRTHQDYTTEFSSVWDRCPPEMKRGSKAKAFEIWERTPERHPQIIEGLRAYCAFMRQEIETKGERARPWQCLEYWLSAKKWEGDWTTPNAVTDPLAGMSRAMRLSAKAFDDHEKQQEEKNGSAENFGKISG